MSRTQRSALAVRCRAGAVTSAGVWYGPGSAEQHEECRTASGTRASALDERLFNHKMAGLAVAAFEEAARFEHRAQLFQHAGAAAHHDAVGLEFQRRQADVVEQLFRGDEV